MSVDVKALRALLDKATPGPWNAAVAMTGHRDGSRTIDEWFVRPPGGDVSIAAEVLDPKTCKPSEANARLIVAAVNALPDLLALAEAVRELAPVLRALTDDRSMIVADGGRGGLMMDAADRDNLRALLAILEPPRAAGDGR